MPELIDLGACTRACVRFRGPELVRMTHILNYSVLFGSAIILDPNNRAFHFK